MLLSLQWSQKCAELKLADKLKEKVISELHLNSIIRINSLRVHKIEC